MDVKVGEFVVEGLCIEFFLSSFSCCCDCNAETGREPSPAAFIKGEQVYIGEPMTKYSYLSPNTTDTLSPPRTPTPSRPTKQLQVPRRGSSPSTHPDRIQPLLSNPGKAEFPASRPFLLQLQNLPKIPMKNKTNPALRTPQPILGKIQLPHPRPRNQRPDEKIQRRGGLDRKMRAGEGHAKVEG